MNNYLKMKQNSQEVKMNEDDDLEVDWDEDSDNEDD